jgi:hypothetical protein
MFVRKQEHYFKEVYKMTAKRYRKLGYALMSKIMAGHKDEGKVLKAIRKAKPNNGLTYAQA